MQTQKRISPSTASPAPFFLPLQQKSAAASASSFFSPSSSPSALRHQKRPQHQQQRVQTTTSSYFKTNEVRKQKESESDLQSSSKLSALHSSLQQEAEKIRKWKNVTELELKHKEKCLDEANFTIDKQRKNITELQLLNESLQSKLKDEIANQKELRRKIASTREMCNALKNHSIKIDESIMKGQEDRDHLMLLNQERLRNYQELLVKYEALEKTQLEWHEKNKQTLAAERAKLAETESKLEHTQQELEQANHKIVLLEDQCAANNQCIESLREEIDTKTSLCDSVVREKDDLQSELHKKQECLERSGDQIQQLTHELLTLQQQVLHYERELEQSREELDKNKSSYSDQVSRLETALAAESDKTAQLLTAKQDLESKLTQTTTDLNNKCLSLSKDLEAKQTEICASQKTCRELEVDLSDARKACGELEGYKSHLSGCVQGLKEELVAVREELSQQVVEKEENMKKAETLMTNVISRQENLREYWKKKESELQARLEEAQKEKEEVSGQLQAVGRQLEEAKSSLETQERIGSDQKEKHEGCIEVLTAEKSALEGENTTLKQEIHDLTMNKETLTAKCSDMDQLTANHESLKARLDTKLSEYETLQNKLVQVETEASQENKRLNGMVETLRNEVTTVRAKEVESKNLHDTAVAELKAAMSVRASELTSLLEQAKKEANKTKTELEREKKDSARKVQDLMAALDSYRSEHEVAMAGKDKALESLTEQLQQTEEMKELSDAKLKSSETEVDKLQSEIRAKNEELNRLLESVKAVCCKDTSSSTPVPRATSGTKKTSQGQTTALQPASPVSDPISDNEVSSTPMPSFHKPPAASTKPRPQPLPPKTTVPPSVPTRLYSYAQTPQQYRGKLTTPKYSAARQKRGRATLKGPEDSSSRLKYRENISYAHQEEDEAVFKKPKLKDVTIERASSTTKGTPRGKKQNKPSKTTPRGKKKPSTDLSWFDLDAVYGFGEND